ncbi:MAG: type II glyceraldehyde-3-phosphate dehydrogenase, partial [Candidatus Aenigmatarchaeota archaeon]
MIKVGINGYGTVGKRVADAVKLQDDMEVVGVTLTRPSFKAELALANGFELYSAIPGGQKVFKDAGIKVSGDIKDLLDKADIIIECSPGKVGAENKKLYLEKGKKAIFQGGEKGETAQVSFSAQANFEKAIGKDFVRVVSCGTTAMCRTLGALKERFGVKEAYVVLVRRAADPWDAKKGPINAIIPENKVPSHHGPDVQTVIPGINIITAAVKVPTTLMHLHVVRVELEKPADREE